MKNPNLAVRLISCIPILFFLALLLFGIFLLFHAITILIPQCVDWLSEGVWKPNCLYDLLPRFGFSFDWLTQMKWKGLAQILNWIFNLSSVLILFLIGLPCVISAKVYSDTL